MPEKWVFSGNDSLGNFFLVPVPDRTREPLVATILKYVLSGSIVVTDRWASYKRLRLNFLTFSRLDLT